MLYGCGLVEAHPASEVRSDEGGKFLAEEVCRRKVEGRGFLELWKVPSFDIGLSCSVRPKACLFRSAWLSFPAGAHGLRRRDYWTVMGGSALWRHCLRNKPRRCQVQ